MNGPRRTRTYLAVPAHRARLVQSAAASAADAVYLDLEDAVPPSEKEPALAAAIEWVSTLDWGAKTLAVRVNAADSPTFDSEVNALAGLPRLDSLILPKAERVDDVARLRSRLEQATRSNPAEIELLIETALGMVNIDALAASRGVTALHLGVGDFAASLGARTSEIGVSPPAYRLLGGASEGYPTTPLDLFAYPMMRLLVAARAFGLRAIDGPCGAFQDDAMTAATAEKAAALGFDGKQVIHPRQIELTRKAFMPTEKELEFARRAMAAMEAAEKDGKGAVTVDGRMIDYANMRMIRRLLSLAD
jgi:malyl-CoA/(S)-citramalyl-CoA lyase